MCVQVCVCVECGCVCLHGVSVFMRRCMCLFAIRVHAACVPAGAHKFMITS